MQQMCWRCSCIQSSCSVWERCAQADAEWLGSVLGFVMCCQVSPVTARFEFIGFLRLGLFLWRNHPNGRNGHNWAQGVFEFYFSVILYFTVESCQRKNMSEINKFCVRINTVLSEKWSLGYYFRITGLSVNDGQGVIFLKLPCAPECGILRLRIIRVI